MKVKKELIMFAKFAILFLFFSCTSRKEITVLGFAYENEKIIIRAEGRKLLNVNVSGNKNEDGLCSFYEKIELSNSKSFEMWIQLDSNNFILMDTVVSIQNKNKEPFISFVHPNGETNFRRYVFVADATDSLYIKQ